MTSCERHNQLSAVTDRSRSLVYLSYSFNLNPLLDGFSIVFNIGFSIVFNIVFSIVFSIAFSIVFSVVFSIAFSIVLVLILYCI